VCVGEREKERKEMYECMREGKEVIYIKRERERV
jgi:hypothetical protein